MPWFREVSHLTLDSVSFAADPQTAWQMAHGTTYWCSGDITYITCSPHHVRHVVCVHVRTCVSSHDSTILSPMKGLGNVAVYKGFMTNIELHERATMS